MKELSTLTHCIVTRDGAEIWIDEERYRNVQQVLLSGNSKFLMIDDSMIAMNDIVAVLNNDMMDERWHAKRGDWQCKYGYWHKKFEECTYESCPAYQEKFPRYC